MYLVTDMCTLNMRVTGKIIHIMVKMVNIKIK